MERAVTFESDGLAISGRLGIPDGLRPGERRPGIVIMHGFGGHGDGPQQRWSARAFGDWGYATLRFDFRGCGDSEGPRGRVTPKEETRDALAAFAFLAARPEVDPARIIYSGTSYGAVVAVSAAAAEPRIAGAIAQGGWGNSEALFRALHPSPEAWARFEALLARARRCRAEAGAPETAHRWDIVPVPKPIRHNIDARSIFDFDVETALATFEFSPESLVGRIAPRPLLLLHSALDGVVPASGSIALFARAGQPCDLHLFSGVEHFMFGEDDPRVVDVVQDWLAAYLPV